MKPSTVGGAYCRHVLGENGSIHKPGICRKSVKPDKSCPSYAVEAHPPPIGGTHPGCKFRWFRREASLRPNGAVTCRRPRHCRGVDRSRARSPEKDSTSKWKPPAPPMGGSGSRTGKESPTEKTAGGSRGKRRKPRENILAYPLLGGPGRAIRTEQAKRLRSDWSHKPG